MDELTFAKPEMAWLAFVVAVIVLLAAMALGRRGKLLARLGSGPVVDRLVGSFSPRVAAWRLVCIGLAMSLLVGALVGPRYGLRETEVANSGIDVVFVVVSIVDAAAAAAVVDIFYYLNNSYCR